MVIPPHHKPLLRHSGYTVAKGHAYSCSKLYPDSDGVKRKTSLRLRIYGDGKWEIWQLNTIVATGKSSGVMFATNHGHEHIRDLIARRAPPMPNNPIDNRKPTIRADDRNGLHERFTIVQESILRSAGWNVGVFKATHTFGPVSHDHRIRAYLDCHGQWSVERREKLPGRARVGASHEPDQIIGKGIESKLLVAAGMAEHTGLGYLSQRFGVNRVYAWDGLGWMTIGPTGVVKHRVKPTDGRVRAGDIVLNKLPNIHYSRE